MFSALLLVLSCGNDADSADKNGLNSDTVSNALVKPKTSYKDPTLPPTPEYSGDHIVKFPNGITNIRGFFRFGKKHGKWASFYPTGQLQSETEYENGHRTGKTIVWYQNGKVMYEGNYKNDQRSGIWKTYDTLGVVLETQKY